MPHILTRYNTCLKSINLYRTLEINFSTIDDVRGEVYLLLPSKLCCIQHKIKLDNKFTNTSSDKQLTDFFRTVHTASDLIDCTISGIV